MTTPFDDTIARRGIDSLNLAYERWIKFREAPPLQGRRSRESVGEESFKGGVLIVEMVRWLRTVDEYLSEHRHRDNEGQVGYDAALANNLALHGMLNGVAHAADKSLHQIVKLNMAVHTPMIVRTTVYEDGSKVQRNDPRYVWMDLSQLPIRNTPRDRAKAAGYATYLARLEIDPVIRTTVEFVLGRRP